MNLTEAITRLGVSEMSLNGFIDSTYGLNYIDTFLAMF